MLIDRLIWLVVRPISTFLDLISQPIHETLLPIPLIPIIYAARISVVYRTLRAAAGGNNSATADLAGFLLMSWGGSIISCIILGTPIPQLLSFTPILLYGSVHLALPNIKRLPTIKTLDTLLPLLDALVRMTTVAAGVDKCRNHDLQSISESLSIQIFVGAISSSGGGILSQAMRVWEPNWRLCRPHFLQEGSILAGTDVWSGALTAAIYGYLTKSHPVYSQFKSISSATIYSPSEAKALSACVLTLIFLWRAHQTHHVSQNNLSSEKIQKYLKPSKSQKPKKE